MHDNFLTKNEPIHPILQILLILFLSFIPGKHFEYVTFPARVEQLSIV